MEDYKKFYPELLTKEPPKDGKRLPPPTILPGS